MKRTMGCVLIGAMLAGSYMTAEAADLSGAARASLMPETSRTAYTAAAYRLRHIDGGDGLWSASVRRWGGMGDGKYHDAASIVGVDRTLSALSRAGIFLSYGSGEYAENGLADRQKDYRLGLFYAEEKGAGSGFLYADYGWQRHKVRLENTARPDSHVWEAGGEYQYDLWHGRNDGWRLSPYINGAISRFSQDGYTAGNWQVDASSNTYAAAETGIELRKKKDGTDYALRMGYKRVLTGNDPEFSGNHGGSAITESGAMDTNYFTAALYGTAPLYKDWKIGGDLHWEKGSRDDELALALMMSRVW